MIHAECPGCWRSLAGIQPCHACYTSRIFDLRFALGLGSGLLAVVVACGMPVGAHRVNQVLINLVLAILIGTSAFCLLDLPVSLIAGAGSFAAVVIVRDIVRFVRHAVYGVTKYTRRDTWYRHVGRAVLGRRSQRWQ